MATALTRATPQLVDNNGGALVTLTGTFVPGRAYRVYVGTDATGVVCYSGVSGQGSLCLATSSTQLTCALPELEAGDVPLCAIDTTDGSASLGAGICRAEAPFLDAMVFSLRRNVRPTLAVGPTDPSGLPDAEPVPGFTP